MSACAQRSAAAFFLCILCVLSALLYAHSIQTRVFVMHASTESIRRKIQRFVIESDLEETNHVTSIIEEKTVELDSPVPLVPQVKETETTVLPMTVKPTVSTTPAIHRSTPDSHSMYQLVLFTTEDGEMTTGNRNVLHMFKLFQDNFSFKAFVFTNTSNILEECAHYGIETLPYVEHNPYGLPYIGSMFTIVYGAANASYYGYINADILVSEKIFELLSYVDSQRSTALKSSFVEICHNAYNYATPLFKPSFSLDDYSRLLRNVAKAGKNQRGPSSIDMFVLSREFIRYKFGPYVIARSRIDTYMLYYCMKNRCAVVDSGNAGLDATPSPL